MEQLAALPALPSLPSLPSLPALPFPFQTMVHMTSHRSIVVRPLSRAEVRIVDKMAIERFGMTGLVLMENAGRNAAEAIDKLAPKGEICILCGKGNNGGDGYVIARHLELLGRQVRIVSCFLPADLTGDAAANEQIAKYAQIPIVVAITPEEVVAAIGAPFVVVDCMLGTGAFGNPREPIASAIRHANQLSSIRIAIDIPSGLDCDTGTVGEPTFVADQTLTFVAPKIGFAFSSAEPVLGKVCVLSIGVPDWLLQAFVEARHDRGDPKI